MHRKHIKFGFLLGLAVGAYYHYVNKDTRKDQDSLYMLVARIKGKLAEARNENSDLHASIEKASAKVKDAADEAGSRVKEKVSKAQVKAEDVADETATKVAQAADSAAKKADSTA